ncbi:4-hydroxythreonine-4-phosphate dehydrogenase PdxA [Candidatus Nitrospira inopinata]|jgi:4-hydroxythreonine-4-phosphate dehydrogenase|uniref:4-hydroxythreonine-4-phosphate dehydrogenase n=1 Tax=Candidatus Nitrospira inopinata TaxID=1715989 RepID=A0A0S4KS69_9BACT|nr:4-hydroxythreonine-4-phosphate dehydrogenase PdxA [Candidatus Nitrospira inopinata]CUQ66173.1 4-hydroxy-L-threonine phosphate dehydrogenase, NAD-dependent [Candidatus Nitrospira inopinata]
MTAGRIKTPSTQPPLLGITMGDPAGIGPEVIAKAAADRSLHSLCRLVVIGSAAVMERTIDGLKLPLTVRPIGSPDSLQPLDGTLAVLDSLDNPLGSFTPGIASAVTGAASVSYIKKAVALALAGALDGIVTAPINKEAINLAGCRYPGHTELLADLTHTEESGMMIVGGPLRVMFATTHLAIKDLPASLTQAKIEKAIRLAHMALTGLFGIKHPRIGVAALNPHAGEHGLFGDEETRVILPASRAAQAQGIDASDPLPADTLFGKAANGRYDAVVALYHDQGLIPLKLVAFGKCVNLTVGLPIIRTSVDHGTAFDIVGKGIADPGSLLEAIKLAATIAANRVSRSHGRQEAPSS